MEQAVDCERLNLRSPSVVAISKDLIEVIGKKLRKRYQKGTILVVLVEQAETIHPNELDAFVHANNPYNQQIVIIGGSGAPGRFKVVPLDEITKPTPGEIAWLEMDVDHEERGQGVSQIRRRNVQATGELVPSQSSGVCEETGPASLDVTRTALLFTADTRFHQTKGTVPPIPLVYEVSPSRRTRRVKPRRGSVTAAKT